MTRKEKEIIKHFSGIGNVFKQDQLIGQVEYEIIVIQDYILSGKDRIPSLKEISGTIQVSENSFSIELGIEYLLILNDGREWKFWAKSGNPIVGIYECVNPPGSGIDLR